MKKSKKIVYKYNPYISIYKENVDNKNFQKKNFHKVKLQDATMVILTNSKKEILVLNEYRRGINSKSLGFPGGHIEKNEKPLDCIKRELYEETGYQAKNWKLLISYVRHGSYHCGKDYIYTAQCKKNMKKKNIEKIEKKWVNMSKIHNLINKKRFKTVGIIASILYYVYINNVKK